jgi:putative phage-type endonuclease
MKHYTISGTEIGSILGLNPWQTPMDLYMRKLGLIDPPVENEAMKWGSAAEHVVARRYAKENPDRYLGPGGTDVGFDYHYPLTHKDYPWWTGTPDREITLVDNSSRGLLEIKIVGERMAHQWGDPPDGDVPEQYLTQCAWYMPLLNVEWADLAVQIGNRDYRVYRINRDREFEDQLRDAAVAFIENHLIPEIPPAIDGSESSKRYLHYRYPKEQGPVLEPTDEEILMSVENYRQLKRNLKDLEATISLYENSLKSIIGDCAGMRGEFGKITWTKNKDSQKVDWEALAKTFNPDSELIDHFTIIKPGARVFRPYFAKED